MDYQRLLNFCESVFDKMGCSKEHSELAAKVLVTADLRGIDSHGVARLSGYVRLWKANRINPTPNITIVHESPSTAVVDADASLGLVSAPYAMEIAIEKAKKCGTGWVSVRNSNHFGIAGYHAELALKNDMIGMAMTNASPLVAPTFSKERMLGTNPIAVAIPSGVQPPFIGDFATTTAANGKLEILQREGKVAPEGWIQDNTGNSSTNPFELKEGGALLPLGSDREHGSHKGFILGSIVDIFSSVLSGANFGPWAPPFVSFLPLPENPVGKGLGHFFGAMRIDAFRPAEEFKRDMDIWLARFREAIPINPEQPVIIPGDPERNLEEFRSKNNFEINPEVEKDLNILAKDFNLTL